MKNLLVITFVALVCFGSCTTREDVSPEHSDYYPTTQDSRWVYNLGGEVQLNTQVAGDTVVDGKNYAIVGGTNMLFPSTVLVRNEKEKYYARGNSYGIYTPEFIFLQVNLSVGGSWTNEMPGGDKDIYTIVSVDERRMIGGKENKNTIEVKRERYLSDHVTLASTQRNIYAEGIGIVASFFIYEPSGYQTQGMLIEYEVR